MFSSYAYYNGGEIKYIETPSPERLEFIYRSSQQWALREAIITQQWGKVNKLLENRVTPIVHLGKRSEATHHYYCYHSPLGKMLLHSRVMRIIEIIEKFLELGVNINDYASIEPFQTPLDMALSTNLNSPLDEVKIRLPLVKLFLSKGAEIKLITDNTLKSFIKIGNIKILKVLLEYGLNPNLSIEGKTLVEHLLPEEFDSSLNTFNNKKFEDDHQKIKLLITSGFPLPREEYLQNILYPRTIAFFVQKGFSLYDYKLNPIFYVHRDLLNEAKKELGAVKIQSYVRRYLAEKEFSNMKNEQQGLQ